MERDIKDYLHLYIGCQVKRTDIDDYGWTLVGVSASEVEPGRTVAIIGGPVFQEWYAEETRPILRPLSDMTEKEAEQIAIIMYGQPDSVKWRLENKGDYLNVSRKHYGRSFTIDTASGDIDRYDGDELETTLQHHYITVYLLSRGFDLFSLIPDGLAIDATTISKPV